MAHNQPIAQPVAAYPEASVVASAPPAYSPQFNPHSLSQPHLFGTERTPLHQGNPFVGHNEVEDPSPLKWCAFCGCLFSWIPIIGLATFCVNWDAPRGSKRKAYANAALGISATIIIFNVIFWPAGGGRK